MLYLRETRLMPSGKTYTVTAESFDSLASFWLDPGSPLEWDCFFVLPAWLKVWWDFFGDGFTPCLCSIRQEDALIGIAPMMRRGDRMSFMGSPEVCDYLDFIVVSGKETEFFRELVEHLRQGGITHLDLGPVRRDSTVLTVLKPVTQELGCKVSCIQEDVSLEVDLPATWEEFLLSLTGKERHEVRRKLRRLDEAAGVQFRILEETQEITREMDVFLTLFQESRPEKAAFMTEPMAAFFRSITAALAELEMVGLSFLDLDGLPAASVLCFIYRSTVYLYNSGYDPSFRPLSAGLLCKVLSIRESIRKGCERYDFLKGAETYKYRLGGRAVPLYRCLVELR
jgi:CelD/BcsL family acetyltransferase involved in cellulose biosynthesis